MPRRNDLHRILIIGSGPIVIGQACEFDYSGTQATKALRSDGYEVVLVNSNPATIMTDPELADRTYVEPLTATYLEEIIKKESPDALLSTVGGQTGLNLAVELAERGVLDQYVGRNIDRFKGAADDLGDLLVVGVPGHPLVAGDVVRLADASGIAHCADEAARHIVHMAGCPQARSVAGHDQGQARPEAGDERLPWAERPGEASALAVGVRWPQDGDGEAIVGVGAQQ